MSIRIITTDLAGEINVNPRLVRIFTDEDFDTVTSAGYLNSAISQGYTFFETDYFFISYNGGQQLFNGIFSNGIITLQLINNVAPGSTTQNHIACFSDSNGSLTEDVSTAINYGNIQAGKSGTAGYLASYPITASTGNLRFAAIPNAANYTTTVSNQAANQSSVVYITDPRQSTGSILTSKVFPADPSANLVTFDVICEQDELLSGRSVILLSAGDSNSYKIRSLQLNKVGFNFGGGGGDRLGQVTDGTTVYTLIPAVVMQSLSNAQWGATALPNPATASISTPTVAGADLVFKYSGGTTDYTAGFLTITGLAEKIA